ncbi:MAG: helix-turn-helix transcriptional regulator [Pseudomonadota bacterium]
MVTRIGPKTLKQRRIFLREWREHRNLTQEQLADRIGTTKASISRIENLARDPQLGFLEAAAEALNCTPSDILSRDPEQPTADQLLQSLTEEQKKQVVDFMEFVRRTGTDG